MPTPGIATSAPFSSAQNGACPSPWTPLRPETSVYSQEHGVVSTISGTAPCRPPPGNASGESSPCSEIKVVVQASTQVLFMTVPEMGG